MRTLLAFAGVLAAGILLILWGKGSGHDLDSLRDWARGEGAGAGEVHWCPMDPQIVRNGTGMCPICNMALVPFEEGMAGGGADSGVLVLTDRQVQQSGVRLGDASVRELVREVDTTGKLELDPGTRSSVRMPYPGRSIVEAVHVQVVGERVEAGDVLCEVTSDGMEAVLEQYKAALDSYAKFRRQKAQAKSEEALERMRDLRDDIVEAGFSAAKLSAWAASNDGEAPIFPVLADAAGTVIADPPVVVGSVLMEGQLVLETADLDELWLNIDLYEHERAFVRAGQDVEFTSLAVPDQVFRTEIRNVEPVVRARTQTVRAQAVVSNEEGALAPGMFVRARIAAQAGALLSVPESAVLQSGRRDVVLVAEGGGRFRPRLVELGQRHLKAVAGEGQSPEGGFGPSEERYHEVLSGVAPGERVVTTGNFLLNAEAQFQGILKKMTDARDAQEEAGELLPEEGAAFDAVLASYVTLGDELVLDRVERLSSLASALAASAADGAATGGELQARFEVIAEAAGEFATEAEATEVDWDALRTHYGTLSRTVVGILRDYQPVRVAVGELHLFRCPMADDFGYDLWVQTDDQLENPYMGQMMVECGMPAELE